MKTTNFVRSSFIVKAAFFILLSLTTTTILQAQTVTFAQFIQRNGSNDFSFTNNGGASANFQTIFNGSPVFFTYQNVAGLPAELQGTQLAHIFITAGTTESATQVATDPPRDIQTFNQTFTIQIIRDTAATSGTGTRRNLLTAVITPDGSSGASLAGDDLGDAIAYTASSLRQNVVFTSDFLGFLATTRRNLGLSFSSVNPQVSIGAGNFLSSFSAAGTGTFASNPPPIFNPPTASNVTVAGRVYRSDGVYINKAAVTLTDSNGESRKVYTNSSGYFRFENVTSGQVVTISVFAKYFQFTPQIVDLQDSIEDISFYPNP